MNVVNLKESLSRFCTYWDPKIVGELNGIQGRPVDIGGYYHPDAAKTEAIMRPSATLNRIVANAGRALQTA